jgi:cytochrome c
MSSRAAAPLICASLIVTAVAARAQTPVDRGAELFKACAACHSIEKDGEVMVGPNLWGVYGAKAAAKDDFAYSLELKEAGLTWTDANLDRWLAGPSKFVPGSIMGFPGLKDPADRVAVIAFLKTRGG